MLSVGLILLSAGVFVIPARAGRVADLAKETRRFYVNYGKHPDPADLLAFDLAILSPESDADLRPGQALGNRYLAYLSLVELREGSPWLPEVKKRGIPVLGTNEQWGGGLVDITHPGWKRLLLERMAKECADRFDGFFIDTVDSVKLLSRLQPERAGEFEKAALDLLKSLREKFSEKLMVTNRGFEYLEQLGGALDGVLVESLFHTGDLASAEGAARYHPVDAAVRERLLGEIARVRGKGLPVFVVDYTDPGNPGQADEIAEKIASVGCLAFITTPGLRGWKLAPVREIPRRILVLYGWDRAETELPPKFAADTFTAERLQMPLEWLGYEVDYHNVGDGRPPDRLDARLAGVLFDSHLELPFKDEGWYLDWALRQKEAGRKLVFTGAFPFKHGSFLEHLFAALGMRGDGGRLPARDAEVSVVSARDGWMGFEAPVRGHRLGNLNCRAPEGANVGLSVRVQSPSGDEFHFDPVFAAEWGGVLLDPYLTFQATEEDIRSLFDPFAFFGAIWPEGGHPVPDTTTRDGLRLFYSHIDGDGFSTLSHTGREVTCAEVIRDRILKKQPFPVTVSVIEADTRALQLKQKEETRPHLEAVARTIFALPNVQAASHTFSHPFLWIADDPEYQDFYEENTLALKPGLVGKTPDLAREIEESVGYIENTLLPKGRKVEMMLWSGNCRPPAEAIRMTRELGLGNMNGGETVVSRRLPGLAGVSPRTAIWDGEVQVYAANQNEYVYTGEWRGPLYGGFQKVIDTFERTEEPRRLKPVNIYYHFYSAVYFGSLRALSNVYSWCRKQPLHAVTARQYVDLVTDSRATRFFRLGDRRWLALNDGNLRTFRLPARLGDPDMRASRGLTGFARHGEWNYLHTNGARRVEIALLGSRALASASRHLRLVDSSAEIAFDRLEADWAEFKVRDLRPAALRFGGVEPGSSWSLIADTPSPSRLSADENGQLSFTLPANSEARLERLPRTASK